MPTPTTDAFVTWLRQGVAEGWVSEPACQTHDGAPCTDAEHDEFELGYDPCITVLRVWPEPLVPEAVHFYGAPG